MEPNTAGAIAVTGNLVLSFGMTLQKLNISWLGRKRPWDRSFYRNFGGWFVGFMLMNIAPIFTFFAVMGLPTNVVAATAGTSVAFTALLAKFLLKERFGADRLAWTIALFASIVAAGFLGGGASSDGSSLSPAALYIFLAIPLLAGGGVFAVRKHHKGPRLASILAAASGCISGFMVFPLRALQVATDPGIAGWLVSPYLYLYLTAGITSFILIQVAYKDGEMVSLAPALYGMQVLWPAIASYFVFGENFYPLQTLAFAFVAICVGGIAGAKPASRRWIGRQ